MGGKAKAGKSRPVSVSMFPHTQIYMYKHTHRKQNKTEQFIAHGPPLRRGWGYKQVADVNHVTTSDLLVTRWCENSPQQEAIGDP